MCGVIRFPNMFGNVRACTDMCLVLREDRLRRMPLASPLVSPSLVKRRFDRRPWPPNETAVWFQKALDWICGYDRRSGRRIETAELDLIHLISRVWFGGLIGGHETAEWNRRLSPASLGTYSAVTFCGHDRRMKPQIVRFQGQFCLFTCPVLDAYKYHTFSFL